GDNRYLLAHFAAILRDRHEFTDDVTVRQHSGGSRHNSCRPFGSGLACLDDLCGEFARPSRDPITGLCAGRQCTEPPGENAAEPLEVERRTRVAEMTRQFCDARPTFDFEGLGSVFSGGLSALPAGAKADDWIATRVREFAAQIVKARQARAKRAAAIMPRAARALTHCNVSGELVAVAQYCREMGKEISVI